MNITVAVQGRDRLPHVGSYAIGLTSLLIHLCSRVIRVPVPIQGQSRLAGTSRPSSDIQVATIQ